MLFFGILPAQYNLVPDSSFEFNKSIPLDYSGLGLSATWSSPTRATPDLFCKCNKKQKKLSRVNVPENAMGNQEAKSGNCYAGVFACSHGYYREYLQTELSTSLRADKLYELTMYISLSDYSPLAIDKFGICFLNKKLSQAHSDVITELRPIYVNIEEEIGMETNEWHKISFIYKAKGGENTLLIGSFGIKRLWKTGNTVPYEISSPIYKKGARDAYYYFDDISVYEFIPEIIDTNETYINPYFANMEPEMSTTEIIEPDTINHLPSEVMTVFKNVLFETGASTLLPSSFTELDILAAYLKADKKLIAEIYGHTDSQGNEQKNIELSYNRAKAVADYLTRKGVNAGNLIYKGLGSSIPISDNDTEEGRKRNRRVEFILRK